MDTTNYRSDPIGFFLKKRIKTDPPRYFIVLVYFLFCYSSSRQELKTVSFHVTRHIVSICIRLLQTDRFVWEQLVRAGLIDPVPNTHIHTAKLHSISNTEHKSTISNHGRSKITANQDKNWNR